MLLDIRRTLVRHDTSHRYRQYQLNQHLLDMCASMDFLELFFQLRPLLKIEKFDKIVKQCIELFFCKTKIWWIKVALTAEKFDSSFLLTHSTLKKIINLTLEWTFFSPERSRNKIVIPSIWEKFSYPKTCIVGFQYLVWCIFHWTRLPSRNKFLFRRLKWENFDENLRYSSSNLPHRSAWLRSKQFWMIDWTESGGQPFHEIVLLNVQKIQKRTIYHETYLLEYCGRTVRWNIPDAHRTDDTILNENKIQKEPRIFHLKLTSKYRKVFKKSIESTQMVFF